VTPEEAGLTAGAGTRRTPGLRREEPATLAGIGIDDYYVRLERAKETRPGPAHVVSPTSDLLATNPAGLRLLTGIEDWPARQRNIARYVFLHPASRGLFHDWGNQVRGCVARLRALAGTHPDSPDLARPAGELLLKSPEFARLWEAYDVKGSTHGRKTFHHPEVGDLTLGYQSMEPEGTPGHRLVAYYAEPGTPDHDAIVLLGLLGHAQYADRPVPVDGGPVSEPDTAEESSR
jgi:hypothetical protein